MMKINSAKKRPAGLYIHIPFCLQKCGYCDFLSFSGCSESVQKRYVRALVKELSFYKDQERVVDTVFIGGGTPSLLHQEYITEILEAAQAAFCIEDQAEISMEANPKTLTPGKLEAYRRAGVNRLSIGVQSMDDQLLRFMGRVHNRKDFLENFSAAREAGFDNINVDLMFGIPGQSREMWKTSLEQVLELSPEHISFYSLQLEEGTEFCRMYREGSMDLPTESEDRYMYHEGIRLLQDAGYQRYEISNSAKPGFACRHNLKYWNFDEYYGTGLGAHTFLYDRGRLCNTADFDTYFAAIDQERLPLDEQAKASREESKADFMSEYVFTALRKAEGLDLDDFSRVFGENFFIVYRQQMEALSQYEKEGLLILTESQLVLTEKGIDVSNQIMAEFV